LANFTDLKETRIEKKEILSMIESKKRNIALIETSLINFYGINEIYQFLALPYSKLKVN
jgi:hypothetical protein